MSLIDAFLLDPVRINIWVSKRADSAEGSGTQQDPWGANDKASFDRVMRGIQPNTCVHLGPGTFDTDGYFAGMASGQGWQMQAGVRIVGSGIDVTTIHRVKDLDADGLGYAIGHELQVSVPSAQAVLVDSAEVSDLTIDAGFSEMNQANVTAGAIRLMGNNARVTGVKIRNWGNKNSTIPGFGIAMLTANTNSGNTASNVESVLNCGIDSCIAVSPAGNSTAPTVALHAGARENPGTLEGLGVAPYIRNCVVDGGSSPPASLVALGMSWCLDGVIEGNTVRNTPYAGPNVGTPHQNLRGARSLIVRNNQFRNVGEVMRRENPVDTDPVQSIVIERNFIELTSASTAAIWIKYLTTGGELRGDAWVLGNAFWKADQSAISNAVELLGLRNLIVRENTLDAASSTSPLSHKDASGGVTFFENRTAAGALIQGRNQTSGRLASELATEADEALLMSLLKRR